MIKKLHIRIVLDKNNESWIIEKMANRLESELSQLNLRVSIGNEPTNAADLNHWMSYVFANVRHVTPTTMLITHLDDPYKKNLVKRELLNGVNVGICLSSHTRNELIRKGADPSSVTYVIPAHDFASKPRRIRIGITTRLYADGRKREHMLTKLASKIKLDAFEFIIFGQGWDQVISVIEKSGANIKYYPGTDNYIHDYKVMIDMIPDFDYYLYMGRDEGSLGTLDALSAGTKTIIPPQGFHVDLPNGITESFWNYRDLENVFISIIERRQKRVDAVVNLTWKNYAIDHEIIWRAVLSNRQHEIETRLRSERVNNAPSYTSHNESKLTFTLRCLSPYRIRSAISHMTVMKPIRNWIDSKSR